MSRWVTLGCNGNSARPLEEDEQTSWIVLVLFHPAIDEVLTNHQSAGIVLVAVPQAVCRSHCRQSVFAVSEICKGMLIFGVGDMATADQFGEAVVIIWQAVGFYGSSRAARD